MTRWVALLALAACHGEDAVDVTYWRDVRPVLDESCARCHTDGGLAPSSFDDPDAVIAMAPLIVASVDAGTMPPPAPDPACADYEDADRYVLDEAEKQVLRDWVAAGVPLGDEADAPAPYELPTLAPFDAQIAGSAPYQPTFAEGSRDDYRCWAVELGNEDDVYLTGIEALIDPEHLGFVHHAVLFDDSDGGWSGGADPADADGFPCGGFGEGDWAFLHGWGPGASPITFGDGRGMRLDDHAKLVIQAHYFDNGAAVPDQLAYGLLLAPEVADEVYQIPINPDDFHIPAGDADYTSAVDFTWDYLFPVTLLSVWPHMHLLGTGFDFQVAHADGTEDCVVRMDGWDFHNQVPARLVDPVVVQGGDTVQMSCHYDNSDANPNQFNDPPAEVSFGEGTNDEMCFGFTYAMAGEP